MRAHTACPRAAPALWPSRWMGGDVMQLAADLDKIHHIAVRCDQAQHQFS